MEVMSEQDIIREAESLSELTITEIRSIGADDSDLSAALNVLVLDGLADEENEVGGVTVHRVERFLLITNGQGFRRAEIYDTEEEASSALADL